MVYTVTSDSATKISESSGTIQNHSRDWDIEISNSADFTDKILLYPRQNYSFSNMDVYLRCAEQGMSAEVFVVPFSVDVGGGDGSSVVDTTALKSVALVDNALNFYTSSDTTQAAYSVDIPAEQFLDQAATTFVPNFYFSAILYPDAVNPNLDGKPVFVLGVKSKSNDGLSNTVKYSFIDVSKLVDTYVASDTSVIVGDYKLKVNISPDEGNALKLKANGLYVDDITDTATSSTFGLTKLYNGTGTNTDGTITQAAITANLNSKLDSDAKAVSATSADKLSAARSLKVDLSSTSSPTFDGSANVTTIGVGGILPTAYGGTGNSNGTVSGAAQLNTSRNIVTNLASTVPASFNGTASVSAGVTGTLPVANGGTGKTSLDNVTVGAAIHDNAGNVISDTYVTKSEFKRKVDAVRLGYRIKKNEADPYERVEYLYDAVGMTPAHMDFDNGVFDYGSWKDVWFVADNKPLMLKSDGTVGYYLNPNDYSEKKDGTASDVANTSYDGNAMAQFPLCWVYRYEDNDYLYEIVSNVQYDSNYKAYAHTDASGNIKPYFYHSLFGASGNATRLRSLSDKTLSQDLTTDQQINGATANGNGWYIESWSRRELVRTLLVLMGKSTNTQAVFGNGNGREVTLASGLLQTGTLSNAGQFYGFNSNNQQVKCFHVEGLWGDQWKRIAGLINSGGKIYVKMTPEGGYRVTDTTGYTNTNITPPTAEGSYISQMICNEYGMIPIDNTGSNSTYFCDSMWSNNSQLDYLSTGCSAGEVSAALGAFVFSVGATPSIKGWFCGCALSFA